MKASMRARRMARNHRRMKTPSKLNLVSLMDIFTILVFFLMVNNGDVEVLQADNSIELPESVAVLTARVGRTGMRNASASVAARYFIRGAQVSGFRCQEGRRWRRRSDSVAIRPMNTSRQSGGNKTV